MRDIKTCYFYVNLGIVKIVITFSLNGTIHFLPKMSKCCVPRLCSYSIVLKDRRSPTKLRSISVDLILTHINEKKL